MSTSQYHQVLAMAPNTALFQWPLRAKSQAQAACETVCSQLDWELGDGRRQVAATPLQLRWAYSPAGSTVLTPARILNL